MTEDLILLETNRFLWAPYGQDYAHWHIGNTYWVTSLDKDGNYEPNFRNWAIEIFLSKTSIASIYDIHTSALKAYSYE